MGRGKGMRFILFDRIVELKKGGEAVFIKNISQSEDFFIDHFPGYPVVPGSIILGSFEQGGEILLASSHDFSVRPLLRGVSKASFRRFVLPGDQLKICVTLDPAFPTQVKASAYVQGRLVGDARLDFSLEKPDGKLELLQACERLKLFYELLTSSRAAKVWDLWERQSQD
ncbi:MAG: beta-hydroxyacyl-ACP dehydratase [Deltaproteobacteria bacterium]|nr:beta-hydroxyacyl-ACP dehydratase [Deltaproteobacteria bacterium]